MRKKTCLYLVSLILIPACAATAAWKVGDKVETQGAKSGIWFAGEVTRVEGDKVTVASWGWMNNPEVVPTARIRALQSFSTVTVRRGGSVWAWVSVDGTIRVGGSIVGSIDPEDGTVRKSGSIVGRIFWNGEVHKAGSLAGSIWPTSEMYRGGTVIGGIDNRDGTIRKGGSIWGSIDGFHHTFQEFRMAFAVLAFFAPEFGY